MTDHLGTLACTHDQTPHRLERIGLTTVGRPYAGVGPVMTPRTIVILSADDARATRWSRTLRARGLLADRRPAGSLELVLAADPTAVVVVDGVPPAEGLRAIADATRADGEPAVLVIGPVEPNIEAMVAIASGALGYLARDSPVEAVADAVEAVRRGEAVLPAAVSMPLVRHLRCGRRGLEVTGGDGRLATLTGREWEVLVLLRQGLTTTQIAREIFVTAGTVRSHVAALVHKFGAEDRATLVGLPTRVS